MLHDEPPLTPAPELESLDHYLDYLVMERVAELAEKVIGRDPELQKTRSEFGKFLAVLENLLPSPGGAAVLNAINETAAIMEHRLQEIVYRRGLEDGVELVGILRKREDRDTRE